MKELIRRLKTQKKALLLKKNLSDVINKIYLERKKSYVKQIIGLDVIICILKEL